MSSSWDSSSIQTLMGSNNGLAGIVGDYNSIKNSSYGKLLKSYYGQMTSDGASKSSGSNTTEKLIEERRNPKVSKEVSTANAALSSAVNNMTSSLSSLQDPATYKDTDGGSTGQTKAASALKSFVSSYNDAVESSKKSTMTNVSKNIAGVMKASQADADKLKEIGITIKSDGTLNLDEKKLASVDADKIKAVFDGNDAGSYGSKVASRMNRASFYVSEGGTAAVDGAATQAAATSSSNDLKSSIARITDESTYSAGTASDGSTSYDKDGIRSAAEDFIKNYNATIDAAKGSSVSGVTSNLSALMKKTASSSGSLSEIGITVGSDGKLAMDKSRFGSSDMSRVADVMTKYGSSIQQNASLLNFYSASQTTGASGYGASGAYSPGNLANSMFSGSV